MSNVVPINLNKASLGEIATYINGLDQQVAINCWHISESLTEAKGICDDPEIESESWDEFLEESVGYSRAQGNRYVQVNSTIGSRGSELAEKGCSFNTLVALSARNLSNVDRKRLIDKMVKKKTISQSYCSQIQTEIRELTAPKVIAIDFKERFVWKPFSERLREYITSSITPGPEYLFGLSLHLPAEEAGAYIKIWKQKYHPDKGGSAEEFSAICRAEEAFIEQQKEKEAGK